MQMARTDSSSSAIRASVIVPCCDDPLHTAANLIMKIGGVEVQCLTPVLLGNYYSGRQRALYTEVMVSGATGSLTVVAYFNASGRTLAPLSSRTYASWEDPTTHQLSIAMMSDGRQLGHAPAFVLPLDAYYMCNCGAFGPEFPVANEGTLGLNSSQLAAYNGNFDTFVRDWHWNGYSTAFMSANITNTSYNSTDLTNSSNGYPAVTTWTGPDGAPPGYRNWREAVGVVGYGGGHNYYGADRIFFRRFIRTGDPEMFIRACAYAESCRHYCRWTATDRGDGTGYVNGLGPQIGAWQMEGWGLAYLFTGNPDMLDQLRRQVGWLETNQAGGGVSPAIGFMGDVTGDVNEPRPLCRALDGYNWLLACEDAVNASTWTTALETRGAQVFVTGGVFTHWTSSTTWPTEYHTFSAKNGGAPAYDTVPPYNGDGASDGDHPGCNEFMNAILITTGRMMVSLCGAYLSTGLKAAIISRVKDNWDRLYAHHFEGQPEQYTGIRNPTQLYAPSFYNGFTGSHVFPTDYSLTPDITALYIDTPAWLAAMTGDGQYTTLAQRFFNFAVVGAGLGTSNTAVVAQKQSREVYCASQDMFYWLSVAPPALPVPSDLITQITIENQETFASGVTATTVLTTHTNTLLKAQTRNFVRLPMSNAGLSVVSSNPSVCTVTIDTTTGQLAITGVSAGTSTITVTNASPSITNNTLVVTVSTAPVPSQLDDKFPGSTLNSSIWTNDSTGPAATITVAANQATMSGNLGYHAKMYTVNAYSLNTAGVNGIQVSVQSHTSDTAYVAFYDSAGNGYAFQIAGVIATGTWAEPGNYVGDGTFTLTPAFPILLRIGKNGSNIEMSHSFDNGDNWTVDHTTPASAFVTTAVHVRCFVGGYGGVLVLNEVAVY
jgi:hypothetical protein